MTANITQLRSELSRHIPAIGVVNRLLCHVLHCSPEHLYAEPERSIDQAAEKELGRLAELLLDGMPLEYATGRCDFFSLPLKVSPTALIPRPETELLVEFAVKEIPPNGKVLELGTGCGAIAVALAKHRPDLTITATDLSEDALQLATDNIKQHRLLNVHCVRGSWFDAVVPQRFQCILSNPPYVATDDPDLEPQVALYEPQLALFSGATGFECLEFIIARAPAYLDEENGTLAVEHGSRQQDAVIHSMKKAGFSRVRRVKDDAGLPRIGIGLR